MEFFFKDPRKLGEEIREFVKSETSTRIKDLSEVMDIHPGNISKRLGANNFKVLELVNLAEYLQVPLLIKFGPIIAQNQFQAEAETIEELKEINVNQQKLIHYMQLAEERHSELHAVQEEFAEYKKRTLSES